MTKLIVVALSVAGLLLGGCETFWFAGNNEKIRQGQSSSLVEYLYPHGEPPVPDNALPHLDLPIRVGIAFVPTRIGSGPSAKEKHELLDRVAVSFADRPFVENIEVIPDVYLRSRRGTLGLRQIAHLHNVDVMALVSYDQLSISAERDSAILYWTVVGALFIKGNSNEVHTMIDTAVFDANSSKLLMRAPGVSKQSRNSNLIDNAQTLRQLNFEGFSRSTDDMIVNLDDALENFRTEVQEGQRAEVTWKAGHGGGGQTDLALLALLTLLLSAKLLRRCDVVAVTI